MLKTKKKHKNLFLFGKLILFAAVLYLLYVQINRFELSDWRNFGLTRPWAFVLSVILVVPNIWLAYKKWTLTLNTIDIETSKEIKIQSYFAGVVTGLVTPNMIGNFIGRFYYFDRAQRPLIIAFTMLSNYAQFIASVTFGLIAFFILGKLIVLDAPYRLELWLCGAVIVAYLVYFFVQYVIAKIKRWQFAQAFKRILNEKPWYRWQLLGLSFGRFAIFTFQFSLMLTAFGADWNLTLLSAIWQVYLLTMLVPSLFLGKVGIKENIALFVLATLGLNDVSILFSSLLIWFINTVTPALVGLLVCKRKLSV